VHLVCGQPQERVPALLRVRAEPFQPVRFWPASDLRGLDEWSPIGARLAVSRLRIPAIYWRAVPPPKLLGEVAGPQPGVGRELPTCPDRSTFATVHVEFVKHILQCCHRKSGRRFLGEDSGRHDPSFTNCIGQECITRFKASFRPRWDEFGHNFVSVGHQHGLSACRESDVQTQLVFQNLYAYSSHPSKVATGSYLVKRFKLKGLSPRSANTELCPPALAPCKKKN
jgi:hypothetical protein